MKIKIKRNCAHWDLINNILDAEIRPDNHAVASTPGGGYALIHENQYKSIES